MTRSVDRVVFNTGTTGTGPLADGTPFRTKFRNLATAFTDTDVIDTDILGYFIEDGDTWEVGTGEVSSSGTVLSRVPIRTSNGDSVAINLTGNAVVYIAENSKIINQSTIPEGGLEDQPIVSDSSGFAKLGERVSLYLAGLLKGVVTTISDGSGIAVVNSTDGVFDPNRGALALLQDGTELYGQNTNVLAYSLQFSNLPNYPTGGSLQIDASGNVYILEPEDPPQSEYTTSTSIQAVNLTHDLITGLTIASTVNAYTAGEARVYVSVDFENTNNRNGTFFIALVEDDVESSSKSVAVNPNSRGNITVDLLVTQDITVGTKLEVACWREDSAQAMSLALSVDNGDHELRLYQTTSGQGQSVPANPVTVEVTQSGISTHKFENNSYTVYTTNGDSLTIDQVSPGNDETGFSGFRLNNSSGSAVGLTPGIKWATADGSAPLGFPSIDDWDCSMVKALNSTGTTISWTLTVAKIEI